MLVLSRKIGEKIVIGDGVVLEVVEIQGHKVRLGITADRSIPIYRQELSDQQHKFQGPQGQRPEAPPSQ